MPLRFFILFIKIGFVSICPEKDVRHPVRESPHLFADDFQINVGIVFNNKFVIDMPDDEAMSEGLHRVAEDAADFCLKALRDGGLNGMIYG